MARIEVKIHGKHYMVSCPDGKEAHFAKLAEYIDQRAAEVDSGRGAIPEAQLLVLVGLLVANELADAYNALEDVRRVGEAAEVTTAGIDAAADRIEALAARLEKKAS